MLAAEQLLVAANANVGAAKALFFPTISLTGLLGTISGEFSNLLKADSNVWQVSPSLFAPIFQGGRIRRNYDAAKARFEQAAAQYQKTALNSYREVANALVSVRKLGQARLELEDGVDALNDASALSRSRYDAGLASYLEILNADQQLFDQELQLAQVRGEEMRSFVELYRALGGGWQESAGRDGATSEAATPGAGEVTRPLSPLRGPRFSRRRPLPSALPAGAQEPSRARRVQITPLAGWGFGGSVHDLATGRQHSFDAAPVYGGGARPQGGAGLVRRVLLLAPADELSGAGPSRRRSTSRSSGTSSASRRRRGTNPRVRWFGTFWLGATRFVPGLNAYGSETRFTGGAGLGVKTFFTKNIGLRLEARGFYTLVKSEGGLLCVNGDCLFAFSGSGLWQGDVGGGLILAF